MSVWGIEPELAVQLGDAVELLRSFLELFGVPLSSLSESTSGFPLRLSSWCRSRFSVVSRSQTDESPMICSLRVVIRPSW